MTAVSDVEIAQSQDGVAKHNIVVLTVAQALNYAVAPLSMSIGGLAGHYLLSDDKTLATLPVTFFILGPLFASMPAALLMKSVGRRAGFMVGALIGFCGCALAAHAILQNAFVLFCAAMFLNGCSIGFAQQYRFAAADFGSPTLRTKAISYVMAGGLAAAIIGPQLSLYFANTFAPVEFAGSFVGGMVATALGFLVLLGLKRPPDAAVDATETTKPARALSEIARQPLFLTALVCAACTYMAMSFVMTAAPLAMVLCGHSTEMATLGIQWHIMAMFGPSFFTGALIVRYGHVRIIGFGMVLFAACSAIALTGIDIAQFWAALIALGIAWNFGYIGATSLVTHCYESHERNKVQGFFDSIVFGLAATTSLLSGVILSNGGWSVILVLVVPLIVICSVTLWAQRSRLATLGA